MTFPKLRHTKPRVLLPRSCKVHLTSDCMFQELTRVANKQSGLLTLKLPPDLARETHNPSDSAILRIRARESTSRWQVASRQLAWADTAWPAMQEGASVRRPAKKRYGRGARHRLQAQR